MNKLPPSVLAEFWMPIDKIGAECMRERGASSALPPLYFLHVWWARRPLAISRAAILGSVLPLWHKGWPKKLLDKFPTEESYKKWFLELIGITGDPVAARKLIAWAKERGIKLKYDPYGGHKRAFTRNPDQPHLETLGDLLEYTWGTRDISVCDPMAGGGSIPFEALRYGFRTFANELNPVASVILKATLEYPARFGAGFASEIKKWGDILANRVKERLNPFFPKQEGESIHAYIWARTVACPTAGKPVPLSPNWWLKRKKDDPNPIAVRIHADQKSQECRFEIVSGRAAIAAKAQDGTVKDGVGRSPWNGDAIDGDYIKAEAQAGRMGQQLYAIGAKTSRGFVFRAPTGEDITAFAAAERELAKRLPEWEAQGLVPQFGGPPERLTGGTCFPYGIRKWVDCFAPRQLLSILTIVEELRKLEKELLAELGAERSAALLTYFSLALDKCCDYNSRMTRWHSGRSVLAGTFDRHDFSFKWSHGEFDSAGNLLPWTISQVADAFEGIAKLAATPAGLFSDKRLLEPLIQTQGSAADLSEIEPESIRCLCVDPPYYDNVSYATLSDFFYVWLKRSLGSLFADWFIAELTDKDEEAIANTPRFLDLGTTKARMQAESDYERKMAACFREMHRVLHPDGVLTVMFTHKKVEAWNTLATSLIGAGFSIQTSWPIHTESEHSLHQAKKNAAASTILLVCRKRGKDKEPIWWDDIKGEVQREAREKARAFHAQGISGVDLYISTFGPVLSILSRKWPVLSSETDKDGHPLPLRPEVALDLARTEVIALRKEELLLGRKVQFDQYTDWYLMAWDAFRAEQFPGDEARKLAIVLGLNLDDLIKNKKIVSKKNADVVLQQPKARRKKGMVDDELLTFESWLDAAHTAMLVYEEDGARACEAFLKRTGLIGDTTFKLVLQAMMNAIPRTRGKKSEFLRPEAQTLDDLRLKFFAEDLTALPEEEPPKPPSQMSMFSKADQEEEGEIEDEPDEEEED